MLQELMEMPVVDPRRDLGFALYVLDELDVRPPPRKTECLPIKSYHLVDYLENLWFDDVLGETPAAADTVKAAILIQAARNENSPDTSLREPFFQRRRLAYERSFRVEVPDPEGAAAAWSGTIAVTLINVSRWPIRWVVGNHSPELWFQPTAEAAAVRFGCHRNLDTPRQLVAPGERTKLSCEQLDVPQRRVTESPDPSALGVPGNWALRSDRAVLQGPDGMDISVDNAEVRQRAAEWVKNRSCESRGACEMEKRDLPYVFLGGLAGFGMGAIAFLLLRFLTRARPVRIAVGLSVLVVVGVVLAGAVLLSRMSGSNDGFLVWGTLLVLFAVVIVAVPALGGIWLAHAFTRSVH
jgi:hypothetical protein